MPSRAFYIQTPDGCLEKSGLEENTNSIKSQSPPTPPLSSDFNIDMEDGEDWFHGNSTGQILGSAPDRNLRRESLINSQQWQEILATHPFDKASDQLFLEDAPFELDDTTDSNSALIYPDLKSPISISSVGYQDISGRSYHGYSSLSLSEERKLRDIAMPSYVLSDTAIAEEGEISNPPKPESPVRRKKRKGSLASEKGDASYLHQTRKQGHNAIEKRYRTNLNDKIAALLQCLPRMRTPNKAEGAYANAEGENAGSPDASQAHKSGKAAVLTGAVEYITELEGNIKQLNSETAALKARLAAFEKLVNSGSTLFSDSAP